MDAMINLIGLLKMTERPTIFLQRVSKMVYLNGMPLSDAQLQVLHNNHTIEVEDTNVWRGLGNKSLRNRLRK